MEARSQRWIPGREGVVRRALPDGPARRLLAVMACPRSGTRFATRILRRGAGLKLTHEGDGVDGSVSCFIAVDDYWYPSNKHMAWARSRQAFDHFWHQVRHPVDAIPSIDTLHSLWGHWQEKHSGVPWDDARLIRAARFWLRWNEIIEPQADLRIRVEDFERRWPELMERLSLDSKGSPPDYTPKSGGKRKDEFSWDILRSMDPDLYDAVRTKAKEYGYDE